MAQGKYGTAREGTYVIESMPYVPKTISLMMDPPVMGTSSLDREAALQQLGRILASNAFERSNRARELLRFLVERTVEGDTDRLKEYTLGTQALGRRESFDPRTDPIVRAEASRLRARLELYYAAEGRSDPLIITLPKGSYVPVFDLARVDVPQVHMTPIDGPRGPLPEPKEPEAEPNAPPASPSPAHADQPHIRRWRFAVLGLALALGLALWAPWRGMRAPQQLLLRLDVDVGQGRFIGSEVGADLAISPDGNWLVFVALDSEGKTHIFRRRLDQSATAEIAGTEGARGPFFSPDSRWVGFWSSSQLKKTLIDGGSPITLCEAPDLLGGGWGEDGSIIAALDATPRLWRVPAQGGTPAVLMDFSSGSINPKWPQVLPGGKAVLFTSRVGVASDGFSIIALSLADRKPRVLIRGGTYGRYVASGHLLYVNRGTLFSVPFNLDRLEVQGAPTSIVEDVSFSSLFGYAQFDTSLGGTLVYRRSAGKGFLTVQRIDSSGKATSLLSKPGLYQYPRLSPDGQRLALTMVDGEHEDVWISDWRSGKLTRITSRGHYLAPVWTPDAQALVVAGPSGGISWLSPDERVNARPLLASSSIQMPWSFSPDGKRLAFFEMHPGTGFDLWTVPIEQTTSGYGSELHAGKPEPFLQTKAFEVYPAFSPDGRWLAYGSNESGTWQVYVRAFPDNGNVVQVSRNGGRIPVWSSAAHDLVYQTDELTVMTVKYRVDGKSFVAEAPRAWSGNRLADTGVQPAFDLAPDGKHLTALMPDIAAGEQQSLGQVTFFLNFFDELRRRSSQHQK